MPTVTFVVPLLNEVNNVYSLYSEIKKYCPNDFELIFIDDGSKDGTLAMIGSIAAIDPCVKCISLSRNFGHQNALMAGLTHAQGQQIIIMDGDGQHPARLIPEFLSKLNEGYDIVHTARKKTADSDVVKSTFSSLFYKFINAISDTRIEANQADFKAFSNKVLISLLSFKERELFLRGLFSWMGYKSATIEFEAPARRNGQTKYTFLKMLQLALKATTSFSFKPLRLALMIGSCISLAAFTFGIFALLSYWQGNTVPGWASLIIAVMFLGGTQLLAIGLLGEYIASLFIETKRRPLYLIDKKINMD